MFALGHAEGHAHFGETDADRLGVEHLHARRSRKVLGIDHIGDYRTASGRMISARVSSTSARMIVTALSKISCRRRAMIGQSLARYLSAPLNSLLVARFNQFERIE